MMSWDFPGGAIVKTLHFYLRGMGSIPGKGTKIPHAAWHGQKNKESTCNAGDVGSIPRLGRSPGGKHGNPLQFRRI